MKGVGSGLYTHAKRRVDNVGLWCADSRDGGSTKREGFEEVQRQLPASAIIPTSPTSHTLTLTHPFKIPTASPRH